MRMLISSLHNKTVLNEGKWVGVERGVTVVISLCLGVVFSVSGLATRRPAIDSGRPKVRMAMPGKKRARNASRKDCMSFASIMDVVEVAYTALDEVGFRLEA
jgi:hypothetical protein